MTEIKFKLTLKSVVLTENVKFDKILTEEERKRFVSSFCAAVSLHGITDESKDKKSYVHYPPSDIVLIEADVFENHIISPNEAKPLLVPGQ